MALIARTKTQIVLCVNREIVIWNIDKETHSKTSVPIIERAKPSDVPADDVGGGDSDDESKNQAKLVPGQIAHLAISPDQSLVAVATQGDKLLHLYKLSAADDSLKLLSQREMIRGSSAMRFTPNGKAILLADKTGECHLYDCDADVTAKGKWLLGHFSMTLDILMTSDSKFVITSDRDEKIRVTCYPRTEIIETYCLGHLEFVPSIETVASTEPLLLSVSGDKTLRLWNYVTGTELVRHELSAPGIKMIVNGRNEVAVVLYDNPLKIVFLSVTSSEGNSWQIEQNEELVLDDAVKYIDSLFYESDDSILAACHTEDNQVSLKKWTRVNGKFVAEKVLASLLDALPSTTCELAENVSIWFKKKIDHNVSDYHDRKKRRLEEQSGKKGKS